MSSTKTFSVPASILMQRGVATTHFATLRISYIYLYIYMSRLRVHLTVRRLFYTTIVRSSRPLDNRKSGRVVRT